MVAEVMENYRNREVGESPLVLSKVPAVIEKHQDYCGMTNNNETEDVTKEQEGKAYVKECIATRRDKEFRNKQNSSASKEIRKY